MKTMQSLDKIRDSFPRDIRIASGNAMLEKTLTFGVRLLGHEQWGLVGILDSDFGPMYVDSLYPPLNSASVATCIDRCGDNFHIDRFRYEWEMEHMRRQMSDLGADSAYFFYSQNRSLGIPVDPNMAIPPEELEGLSEELGRPPTEAEFVAFSAQFTKTLVALCGQ